jgi:hypothetical protein
MKLLVLAGFLYPVSQTFFVSWYTLLYEVPIAVVCLWAGVVWWLQAQGRRRSHTQVAAPHQAQQRRHRLPLATFLIVVICLMLHYGAFLWFASLVGASAESDIVRTLTTEAGALSFLLLPVLFLSGSDFTEWTEVLASQVASLLQRLRAPWVLAGLTGVAATAILLYRLVQRGTFAPLDIYAVLDVVSALLIGGLFALLLLGVLRLGRVAASSRTTVPVRGLVIASIVTMGILVGPGVLADVIVTTQPTVAPVVADFTVYKHTATSSSSASFSPTFSIAYPSPWTVVPSEPKDASDLLAVGFLGAGEASTPVMLVVALPAAAQDTSTSQSIRDVVEGYCSCSATLTGLGPHGDWGEEQAQTVETDQQGKRTARSGYIWWQMRNDTLWLVYGLADSAGLARYTAVFTSMVDSWRPDLLAVAPTVPDNLPPLVTTLENFDPNGILSLGLVPLLLGLFVGLPALIRGRRRPGALTVMGLFLVVYGLRSGFLFLPQLVALVGLPATHIQLGTLAGHPVVMTTLPSLNEAIVQIDVAIATLLALGWLALRRRVVAETLPLLGLLFTLNVGLQVLLWLDQLFQVTNRLSTRFSILAAVLVVGAFLWDLLTSGEQLTGHEHRGGSRLPRVLLYLGYNLLGFTVVLAIATLSVSSLPFDTGDWTETGLVSLGIPLLLTGFLLRVLYWRAIRQRPMMEQVAPVAADAALTISPSGIPALRRTDLSDGGAPIPH